MKGFIGIIFFAVGCLTVAGCFPRCHVIDRYPVSESSRFELDLDKVREKAIEMEGDLPIEVRSLVVAEARMPKWFVTACGGFGNHPCDMVAYQVVYPDRTVIIDSCFDVDKTYGGAAAFLLRWFQLDTYSRENYQILQEAMRNASKILVTHEHFDHIGGISASPYLAEILPRVLLTEEQIDSSVLHLARFPEGSLDEYVRVPRDRYSAVAPGIVLIKAPGHAPGQQIIYIKTQNGNEYLLIGDVIWNRENLRRRTYRSWIASIKDDLDSAREEFRWVLVNLYDNPDNKIIYVISHDRDQLREYIDAGVIKKDFR